MIEEFFERNPGQIRMPSKLSDVEMLAYSTIRIECQLQNGVATGTGFVFSFAPQGDTYFLALVTNKHVIEGATAGWIHVHLDHGADGRPLSQQRMEIPDFQSRWLHHPSADVDLCVLPMEPLFEVARDAGHELCCTVMHRELIPTAAERDTYVSTEEIVMIGYPNGVWDNRNNMPVFRRGIAATHPRLDYCGTPEFLIDAACFPGSSGSPVLLFNRGSYAVDNTLIAGDRVRLLGILRGGCEYAAEGEVRIGTFPSAKKPVAVVNVPQNLGVVVRSELLFDFDRLIEEKELDQERQLKRQLGEHCHSSVARYE